mgnify:CR=1 FL=1
MINHNSIVCLSCVFNGSNIYVPRWLTDLIKIPLYSLKHLDSLSMENYKGIHFLWQQLRVEKRYMFELQGKKHMPFNNYHVSKAHREC